MPADAYAAWCVSSSRSWMSSLAHSSRRSNRTSVGSKWVSKAARIASRAMSPCSALDRLQVPCRASDVRDEQAEVAVAKPQEGELQV